MRTGPSLFVAAFASLGLLSCNWGDFDPLLDKAPVVVFAPPGSSTSSAFVLPLSVPSEAGATAAARMLVSRTDSDYLGVADFDLNGKVTLTEAPFTERGSLRGAPVRSGAVRADGAILLGVPAMGGGEIPAGGVVTLQLVTVPGGGHSFVMQPSLQGGGAGTTLTRLGLAVAAGKVTGSATGDFVVAGDNTVHVVGVDGRSEVARASCSSVQLGMTTAENYPFRPLAVGDLFAGGYDEIVVGSKGRVAFLQWDGTATLLCSNNYLTMGAALEFGSSLAVADFSGDGLPDLAVGSPPDKVYLYFGPLDRYFDPVNPVLTPSVTITNTLPNTRFGQRIASYQLPGAAVAQLLVADPAAPGDGFTGKVMLFGNFSEFVAQMADTQAVATLFDSRDDVDPGLFGMGLGALAFNPQLCLPGSPVQLVPWATNKLSVLTYFNYPAAASDPRCFALNP